MDTGKLYIPNLNAIPLFLKDQLPRDGYSVKYEQGDMTCIQLFCIDAEFEVKIYLRDVSGKLTGTFAVNTSTVRDENGIMIRFYTALIKFSQVNEGGYYIEISIKNNIGEVCSYYSPCIDVRKRHRKTFLTEYFNSENINNVLFDNGTSFALRVEGGFLPKSYIPKVQETIYQNQSVEFKLLQSMPYNSNTLTVGRERGVPDWIFDKVHRALSCDNTIIDNVAMTKIEGAAWSPNEEEGYNFRTWKIELVQNNDNISRPVLCVEQAVYTCSYEWLDADAVCQLEPDNVIETVEFAEYVCQVAQPLGNAFAKTATYRRYVNGELQEEITKSLLTDVNPVLTESQYQLLNVPDVEERVAAVIYLFDVETEPEYLSEAVIGNAECMNPEYVPVTFEDVFIEYEYDDDKIIREGIDIKTGSTYPGVDGIGLVQKTINPKNRNVSPNDFIETASTLYWRATQSFVINGKTYSRDSLYNYPQRLPSMSIMPSDSIRKTTFFHLFTVPETKEYIFITATDNYSWVYIDGNPVFEKSDSADNNAFIRAYAFRVFLTAGTHMIKNVWQDGDGNSYGTVTEIYDCTWEELAYDYASLQAARNYLTPHLILSTGQYFTDVTNGGTIATGVLSLVYISDADEADGWELILEDGEARGARRLTETPTGFEIASHLKMWVAGVPADIDGNPCAVSGKPQAAVINAESFAGAAAGNIVSIGGVPYQVEDIFLLPGDLYTNPDWRTNPVLWNGVTVAQYIGD